MIHSLPTRPSSYLFSGTGRFAGTPASTWPGSSASPGDWINSTRSLRFLRRGAGEKNAMPKLRTLVLAGGLVLACPAMSEPLPPIEDFVRHATYSGTSIRSEEHTSELQSPIRSSYAVFCLKKKKTTVQSPDSKQTRENT